MQQEEIIQKIAEHFQREFADESTGHDWFHIERVWKNAKLINATEGANSFVVELGALMHDIADHKFVENAEEVARERTESLLSDLGVAQEIIDQVQHIIEFCSFKGGIGENKMKSFEGKIVQDADRLDAIGAIGIARTFAFGGKFGSLLYHPGIAPMTFKTPEEYRKNRSHTINHFYEKLLLLKDGMNTATGKELAENRHQFMEDFLRQFYAEWEGRK